MKLDDILGKIIALTRQIKLRKPEGNIYLEENFIAGERIGFFPVGGVGMQWWYTKKGIAFCDC